jgi:hypothetical protein
VVMQNIGAYAVAAGTHDAAAVAYDVRLRVPLPTLRHVHLLGRGST